MLKAWPAMPTSSTAISPSTSYAGATSGLGRTCPIFNALSAACLAGSDDPHAAIARRSEDAMAAVPDSLREAAYGLGATQFEVSVRVVVPAALSGIIAFVLLAVPG